MSDETLGTAIDALAATIRSRAGADAATSYTASLLQAGPAKCAKKLGEEAAETIIAALAENDAALTNEAADLVYHLLVLLESRNVGFGAVLERLEARMGTSGLTEKAARTGG